MNVYFGAGCRSILVVWCCVCAAYGRCAFRGYILRMFFSLGIDGCWFHRWWPLVHGFAAGSGQGCTQGFEQFRRLGFVVGV